MSLTLLVIHFLLTHVRADVTNQFILKYFNYKRASSIVGYSCNNMTDDVLLIKYFNKDGLTVTLNKWTNDGSSHFAANTRYSKIGVFLDTRCQSVRNVESIYLDATNHRMYGDLHYWLLLGNNLADTLSNVNDNAFGLATDFVIAVNAEAGTFNLYDVYNTFKQRGCRLNVTFYGHWSSQSGLNVSLLQLKSARRSNLYGLKLKVLFFQSSYRPKNTSLEEYFQNRQDVTKDGRVKFGYNIIKSLAEMYNFSIEFIESENWLAGDTLGPLVRCLMNSSVDLSGTSTIANSERAKFMKFLHQGWPFRTCFIFRNPQPKSMRVQEILRPFADSVWYLMGFIIILGIFILAFTLKLEGTECDGIEVGCSFTITIGAACQQNTDIKMSRLSTRIGFLSVMMFSLMMYNYYSASVVSARLDEPITKINDSLMQLGKLNLKMASERMFFLNFFFAAPHWDTQMFHKNYWLKIPESQRFVEPEVGMNLVQKGQYAYHVHPDTGYVLIEKMYENREVCELMEVHVANRLKTLFGVTNNSTVEEIIRVGLTKISETGLRNVQLKRWQYKKPRCRKDILNASSVNISEFAPHLLLLALGMLASFLVYSVELIVFKCGRKLSTISQSNGEIIVVTDRQVVEAGELLESTGSGLHVSGGGFQQQQENMWCRRRSRNHGGWLRSDSVPSPKPVDFAIAGEVAVIPHRSIAAWYG